MSSKDHDEWVSSMEIEYDLQRDAAIRKFDDDWEASIYKLCDMDDKPKKSSMLSLPDWKDYVIAFFITLFGVIAVYIVMAGSYDHE
mgnify:CR=1 FL=1